MEETCYNLTPGTFITKSEPDAEKEMPVLCEIFKQKLTLD